METFIQAYGGTRAGEQSRKNALFFDPPVEIQAIRRGAYAEFVGLSINEGRACWTGFDLDSGEAVKIDLYGGENLDYLPPASGYTNQIRRQKDNGNIVEILTCVTIDTSDLQDLAAQANTLWSDDSYWNIDATDIHNAIILLDGDVAKLLGGPGLLTDVAEDFRAALEQLFRKCD